VRREANEVNSVYEYIGFLDVVADRLGYRKGDGGELGGWEILRVAGSDTTG